MNQETSEKKITEMVRRVVESFSPEKIILFGSHARGMAKPDSDADLLIIMPIKNSRHELRLRIRCALYGIGMAKDILVITAQEYEAAHQIVGTVERSAWKEGKVLYERAA
jgi:uncharacterized protein